VNFSKSWIQIFECVTKICNVKLQP
jgi:hypothetical protein